MPVARQAHSRQALSPGTWKRAPEAGIGQQNGVETAVAALDIAKHLPEAGAAVDPQAAPALVATHPHEPHAMAARVSDDGFELLAEGLAFEPGRGAEIARDGELPGTGLPEAGTVFGSGPKATEFFPLVCMPPLRQSGGGSRSDANLGKTCGGRRDRPPPSGYPFDREGNH